MGNVSNSTGILLEAKGIIWEPKKVFYNTIGFSRKPNEFYINPKAVYRHPQESERNRNSIGINRTSKWLHSCDTSLLPWSQTALSSPGQSRSAQVSRGHPGPVQAKPQKQAQPSPVLEGQKPMEKPKKQKKQRFQENLQVMQTRDSPEIFGFFCFFCFPNGFCSSSPGVDRATPSLLAALWSLADYGLDDFDIIIQVM